MINRRKAILSNPSLSLEHRRINTTLAQTLKKPFLITTNTKKPISNRAAISRTKKEETIEPVKQQLQDCHLIAGIKYKGLVLQQFRELRTSLPESSKLIVTKNTLVLKAIEGTQWEALKPCMTGMNAWLFVHSEEKLQAPARNLVMMLSAYVKKLEETGGRRRKSRKRRESCRIEAGQVPEMARMIFLLGLTKLPSCSSCECFLVANGIC